jgi:hypothetical protein
VVGTVCIEKARSICPCSKKSYQQTDQKFGIEIPKTVKRALEIDAETGTTFWADAIGKEMKGMGPVVSLLSDGSKAPVGHQKIPCHMIFDVKMDFTSKLCCRRTCY